MREAKKLRAGDKIGLVGTSGLIPPDRLEKGIEFVKSLGFEVEVGESCTSAYGYLSGKDEVRAADLNRMFADPEIDGVFCMRGGYGAPRIMDMIDFEIIKKNPKVFIGYSDITAIHNAINQRCDLITYHSPMPSTEFYLGVDEFTLKSFLDNIMEYSTEVSLENIPCEERVTLVSGTAQGELTGGNLSLIAAMIGTPYEIDCRDKILFLEDVDEEPYRIDRMLTQLRLAGKLDDAAGFILGAFTNSEPKNPEKSLTLDQVIEDLIVSRGKPAIKNFTAGHVLPTLTLPMGKKIYLDADKKCVKILD